MRGSVRWQYGKLRVGPSADNSSPCRGRTRTIHSSAANSGRGTVPHRRFQKIVTEEHDLDKGSKKVKGVEKGSKKGEKKVFGRNMGIDEIVSRVHVPVPVAGWILKG